MPSSELSGVLLVGGSSRRFGSPKALAPFDGKPMAERAWELLGEVCDERIAVGKYGEDFGLSFPVVPDEIATQAALAGLVAGLRVAKHDLAVVVAVDCPLLSAADLRALADGCTRDVAVSQSGPLPGAYRRTSLRVLEHRLSVGDLRLRDALAELRTDVVRIDLTHLADVNTTAELARAERIRASLF